MMTAPGGWIVEQVVLDAGDGPVTYLRVKKHGRMAVGAWPNGGYARTPDEVASILGDAFAELVPA